MVVSMFVAVKSYSVIQNREAIVKIINAGPNTGKDPVNGTLYLRQTMNPNGVQIDGQIYGLEPGKHGFHVHAEGDLGNACKNAAGHFNPQMVNVMVHWVVEFINGMHKTSDIFA